VRSITVTLLRRPAVTGKIDQNINSPLTGPAGFGEEAFRFPRRYKCEEACIGIDAGDPRGRLTLAEQLAAEDAGRALEELHPACRGRSGISGLEEPLSIRLIFHQLEQRTKAHILVAFLGYALWVTLKHPLRRKGSALSPSKALALLSTLVSADIDLPTTDGREIRLQRITKPTSEQKQLFDQLGIAVPDRLSIDRQCG